MTKIALKPFTTRLHRFGEGDDIPPGADLSPRTLPSLEAGGVVGDKPEAESTPRRKGATK